MQTAYLIVLSLCTAAVVALVALRSLQILRGPRPTPGRLWNEWAWTVIPLLVLAALLWHALRWRH